VAFETKYYQVGQLHQKHYTSSFLITVIYHYLSLVSQLSVNYVCCSFITACCYAKQDFFTYVPWRYFHSH